MTLTHASRSSSVAVPSVTANRIGAERLIGILVDGATEPDDPAREEAKARWCKEAFLAILEEDAQAVPRAAELIAHVRATVGSA